MRDDDLPHDEHLEALAERVRVLQAALTNLLEVVRDVVSDGEGPLGEPVINPGLLALAKKALREAEEVL